LKVKPYQDSTLSKKEQVSEMFNTISSNYDVLNRVISFGIDVRWRNKIVDILKKKHPKIILDVATGTGDLAINLCKTNADKIIGLDISHGMLDIGKTKIKQQQLDHQIEMILGDSEQMPFDNNTFDAITVAFGIRNFENLEIGLKEIYRVLKPKGDFIILETSQPTKIPYKQLYKLYSTYILPNIGKFFSKDKKAYKYLSESASVFPFGQELNNILKKIGFTQVTHHPQTFGVATIYKSTK